MFAVRRSLLAAGAAVILFSSAPARAQVGQGLADLERGP